MLWYVTVVHCSVIYLWKMIVVLLSNYQRLQHVCWWLRPAKARRQRTGNGPCRSTKSSILPVGCSHEFDHGLFLNLPSYCWWKKSCTSWWVLCSIIFRVLTIQGGAGFLPSTVPWFFPGEYQEISRDVRQLPSSPWEITEDSHSNDMEIAAWSYWKFCSWERHGDMIFPRNEIW